MLPALLVLIRALDNPVDIPPLGAGSFLSLPFVSLARLALLLLFSGPVAAIFRSCTRVLYTIALVQVDLQ